MMFFYNICTNKSGYFVGGGGVTTQLVCDTNY